jgi:hypothetical protein
VALRRDRCHWTHENVQCKCRQVWPLCRDRCDD